MDAIITIDEQQRVVLFNSTAEALFGWPQSEALHAPLEQFIPERLRAAHAGHIRRFGEAGIASRRMATQRIVTALRRNGEEFPIEASISQVTLDDRKYFTVIVRDVTERLRAEEALRRSRAELHEFTAATATAREQEKRRVARELHDELAQSLAMLRMDLSRLREGGLGVDERSAARIAGMQKLLESTIAATRRIAADLRPLVLDDLGLVPAIEWLVDKFEERYGIACDVVVDPPGLTLADPHATAVFRIMQEALANVGRHAGASNVKISLVRNDGEILVRVHDDGRGFDLASARRPGSFGLVGLRERAHLVDGELRLSSTPGHGTCVDIRMPVPRTAPEP